jgi:hypothetical protein
MDRGSQDIDGSFVPGEPARRVGGRPSKEPTVIVSVRLPVSAYDACCVRASRDRAPVRSVMRRAISEYIRR